MIVTSVQLNTPGTPSREEGTSACSTMPFGLTFALQSVRTGHAGAYLPNAIELKGAALGQFIDTSRSRVDWGSHRV